MQNGLCGMMDAMYARDHDDPLGVYGKKKNNHYENVLHPETPPRQAGDILRVWKEQTDDGSTIHVHTSC